MSAKEMYDFLSFVQSVARTKLVDFMPEVMPGAGQWKNGWLYASASKCNQIFFFRFASVIPGNTTYTTAGQIWVL